MSLRVLKAEILSFKNNVNFKEAFRLRMFLETQNYTNENLNVLKKRYNDNEGW